MKGYSTRSRSYSGRYMFKYIVRFEDKNTVAVYKHDPISDKKEKLVTKLNTGDTFTLEIPFSLKQEVERTEKP